MIKFMDRSIWYYIKRPMFTYGLIGRPRGVRLYSLFIMDLLEQDLLEYRYVGTNPWSSYKEWTIKGTNQQVEYENICYYIVVLLTKKRKEVENKEQEASVKLKMTLALQAIQTNSEGETK